MKDKIEKAIENIAEKCGDKEIPPLEAQQYAQAALNLSNVLIGLENQYK